MATFLGMRGTGDWTTVADNRPMNWRNNIFRLYPNGSMPLTGITSMMRTESTDDPQFHWWEDVLPTQAGAITGLYTDSIMSAAYASGGVAGTVLYVKCAEATALQIRAGHVVVLRDSDDYNVDVMAKVLDSVADGANSKISVKLLEADDNATGTSHDLSDADRILVAGSVNAEGATRPTAISREATKIYNYTQIFRTPVEITGTQMSTRIRPEGDAWKLQKRDALELHGMEMEKAFIWGIPTENTGTNGKQERTTGGLLHFTKTYASDNVADYTLETDSAYASKTWKTAGKDWLNTYLEQIFRYGDMEKLALCGSGAVLGLNILAETYGDIQLKPAETAYGLKVMKWLTPFGEINLKIHPLFSYEATNRNSMLIVEPKRIKMRPLKGRDTKYIKDSDGKTDGLSEEWLTEIGFEYNLPETGGYLNGVGLDNSQ